MVVLVSVYIASKINETLIKLELIVEATSKIEYIEITVPRDKLIILECKMIELFGFQFDIRPAHFFFAKDWKTIEL